VDRQVRDATAADAAGCAAVYAPYVRSTAVSFELEPPDEAEMATRIESAQRRHAWLVLVDGTQCVVGYAYAGPWRTRPAYRFTCEVSVYLDRERRGQGGGRLLYQRLLDRLAELGHRTAVAGMTEPNPASTALHRSLGFTLVGTLPAVGWKLDAWRDVTLWSLDLRRRTTP
jgi:phosphinothricin acetyltransferase